MKNKQKKEVLDEMQERSLLKLEEAGFWLVFWSLFASIVVQFLIKPDVRLIAGEAVVLLIAGIYIAYSTVRKGLWTKHSLPTRKANAAAGGIAGLLLGVVHAVRTFVVLQKPVTPQLLGTVAIRCVIVGVLCFAILELLRLIYQRKRARLDGPEEDIDLTLYPPGYRVNSISFCAKRPRVWAFTSR